MKKVIFLIVVASFLSMTSGMAQPYTLVQWSAKPRGSVDTSVHFCGFKTILGITHDYQFSIGDLATYIGGNIPVSLANVLNVDNAYGVNQKIAIDSFGIKDWFHGNYLAGYKATGQYLFFGQDGRSLNIYGVGSGSPNTAIGHLSGLTGKPGAVGGPGAGAGPTISVTGTDMGGLLVVTTGTGPTGSGNILLTLTFSRPFLNNSVVSAAPIAIMLTPANQAAKNLSNADQPYVDYTILNAFSTNVLTGTGALSASTTYAWYYWVIAAN